MDEQDSSVVKPDRQVELETKPSMALSPDELQELDNLQAAHLATLALANDEDELEFDPVTGLVMEYRAETISTGYEPRQATPQERFAFGRAKHPRMSVEGVAKAYKVPYWLVDGRPKPSWLKRPIWRFRAWRWRKEQS